MDGFFYVVLALIALSLALAFAGIKVVPQSQVYLVERYGRFTHQLKPGLNFIVPFLDRVAFKVSVLERQLPAFEISVITKDNVEVDLEATVFYRVIDAEQSVYRVRDIDAALNTTSTSIVRSAAGRLELDELQSSRDSMNREIAKNLKEAAEVWGVDITRTEITDVKIDEETKSAQRQQLNAERERRAVIARSEGERRAVELAADAQLYEAQKRAEAIRVEADAKAYAVEVAARADAEQTRVVGRAIADNGQPAVNFEIMKRQVQALGQIAGADNSKTVVVPTDIAGVIGSIHTIIENIQGPRPPASK